MPNISQAGNIDLLDSILFAQITTFGQFVTQSVQQAAQANSVNPAQQLQLQLYMQQYTGLMQSTSKINNMLYDTTKAIIQNMS